MASRDRPAQRGLKGWRATPAPQDQLVLLVRPVPRAYLEYLERRARKVFLGPRDRSARRDLRVPRGHQPWWPPRRWR